MLQNSSPGFQNQEREVIFLKNNTKAPGNCWSPELFCYHTAFQIPLPAPRADMHRAALLFVGFYGILLAERRCPASAAVMLPPSRHIVPRQEEVQFFVILLTVRMFLHENLREDSTMEILNTVIALLGLLATVILGTAKITWTIAQVFFRDMHHAKHYIKK